MNIKDLIKNQKNYFSTQKTKDILVRKAALKRLLEQINLHENEIAEALYNDFRKSKFESFETEIGIVQSELRHYLKKIKKWAKPKLVLPAIINFPSCSKIYPEPYGTVLIISPWNYPFQLAITALLGAVAAGNTVVLKPSELTPNTSKVLNEIITSTFDKNHVAVVEGDVAVAQKLLEERWDYIFFTGSVSVGKIIAKIAAKNLTPVTLELGGKSPCIIDKTASIKLAAKRLVWGKFLNGGQTCIAPDYVVIHKDIATSFISHIKTEIELAYRKNPQLSDDYPRIINLRNFDRLNLLLKNQKVIYGGKTDEKDLYISPTIIENPGLDSEVMKDEIFGPILPFITYEKENEIDNIIENYEKPLSFYIFSKSKSFVNKLISKHSFGGGVINDSIVHFANRKLPFGGVGYSGIGSYHGKQSFDTFTHQKSITKRYNWLDLPIRYAPYKGKLSKLKFLMKYFS